MRAGRQMTAKAKPPAGASPRPTEKDGTVAASLLCVGTPVLRCPQRSDNGPGAPDTPERCPCENLQSSSRDRAPYPQLTSSARAWLRRRNSEGDMPICFWKTRLNWEKLAKPQRLAASVIGIRVLSSRDWTFRTRVIWI